MNYTKMNCIKNKKNTGKNNYACLLYTSDTFFFCIMDKTAGIDHDDVCLLLIVRYREFVMC